MKIKGIKEYYDDSVDMWIDDWYCNDTMVPFLKNVKLLLNNKVRVLDLGCNSGYETSRMKKIGLDPVGLDFSKKSIDEAKKRNKDISFVCDDMLNDLTYLGKFDAVVAIASIIHIPVEKLSICFKRIFDILNDDGYLFMVVRTEEGKLDASYKEINGVKYDREVYGYSLDLYKEKMDGLFDFFSELPSHDVHWKYYVFKKKSK